MVRVFRKISGKEKLITEIDVEQRGIALAKVAALKILLVKIQWSYRERIVVVFEYMKRGYISGVMRLTYFSHTGLCLKSANVSSRYMITQYCVR